MPTSYAVIHSATFMAFSHLIAIFVPSLFAEEKHPNAHLDNLIGEFIKNEIPHKYTDDKKWNKQIRQYDGIQIRREGWKLETKRKWKLVNHGTWNKYSIGLVDPDKKFAVNLLKVQRTQSGEIGFEIQIVGQIWFTARQSKWVRNVQIYSVSAEGSASVSLKIKCQMDIKADWRNLPPDLILKLRVMKTQIELEEFRINRVSKISGELAQQVTKATRSWLEERKIKEQTRLTAKLNEQISKHQDKFRLSAKTLKGDQFVDKFLPHINKPIRDSIKNLDSNTITPSKKTK